MKPWSRRVVLVPSWPSERVSGTSQNGWTFIPRLHLLTRCRPPWEGYNFGKGVLSSWSRPCKGWQPEVACWSHSPQLGSKTPWRGEQGSAKWTELNCPGPHSEGVADLAGLALNLMFSPLEPTTSGKAITECQKHFINQRQVTVGQVFWPAWVSRSHSCTHKDVLDRVLTVYQALGYALDLDNPHSNPWSKRCYSPHFILRETETERWGELSKANCHSYPGWKKSPSSTKAITVLLFLSLS